MRSASTFSRHSKCCGFWRMNSQSAPSRRSLAHSSQSSVVGSRSAMKKRSRRAGSISFTWYSAEALTAAKMRDSGWIFTPAISRSRTSWKAACITSGVARLISSKKITWGVSTHSSSQRGGRNSVALRPPTSKLSSSSSTPIMSPSVICDSRRSIIGRPK